MTTPYILTKTLGASVANELKFARKTKDIGIRNVGINPIKIAFLPTGFVENFVTLKENESITWEIGVSSIWISGSSTGSSQFEVIATLSDESSCATNNFFVSTPYEGYL